MVTNRDGYKEVQLSEDASVTVNGWIILRRQIMVSSAVWASFFTLGLLFGTSTVYIAQTRREANSTDAITDEMASWISSTHSYSAIPFFFIMAAFSKYFGRKKTFLFASFMSAIGFITIYLSTSVRDILIGECILGILIASDFVVCAMVLTEYTITQYRGFFLTFKSATCSWGILVANTVGIFIHWRNIAILGCACSAYSFLIGLKWPESPYWFASKENYNACSKSHYWLKGHNEESLKELKGLIRAHQQISQIKRMNTQQNRTMKLLRNLFSKSFYRPFIYATMNSFLYHFSGKMVCNIYAIQIINGVINNESLANTGTLIVDAVCVTSMYFASSIIKCYDRKSFLLVSSLIAITFLFLISIYLFLVRWEKIGENKYIFLFLLTMYMISISCGPVTLSPTIVSELCPLRYRGFYMLLVGLTGNIIMATVVKLAPCLFSSFGSHGAFLFFAISSLSLLSLIYFCIPETKDKTIVDISNLINK